MIKMSFIAGLGSVELILVLVTWQKGMQIPEESYGSWLPGSNLEVAELQYTIFAWLSLPVVIIFVLMWDVVSLLLSMFTVLLFSHFDVVYLDGFGELSGLAFGLGLFIHLWRVYERQIPIRLSVFGRPLN